MRSDLESLNQPQGAEIGICETHGEFEQRVTVIIGREFRTGCPTCSRERQEREVREEAEREASKARRQLEQKLESALIPKRFATRAFENYQADTAGQRKALATCREYAEHFRDHYRAGRCLLLLGKPGTGKTHLAAAIANQVMRNSKARAIYRTLGGLLQEIRATYDRESGRSEVQVMSAMVEVELLVLDEIGATKPTEFELATLFAVINGRYEQQKPTVIVSNLMPDELPAAIGERCVDRLREGGGTAMVFDWASKRAEIGREA